jgi:hypothetical protein
VVGGLTSDLTTSLSQRAQTSRAARPRNVAARQPLQGLYRRGIEAYGDAVLSNEPQIQEFPVFYVMISRMRLMSLPRTVACAEKVMDATLATYFSPNKTIRELHEL